MNQEHHPLPCREVACFPSGPGSAIAGAPHGAVSYSEADAVVLVAVRRGHGLDPGAWEAWSGAAAAGEAAGSTFLGSTLHECVDEAAAFSHVVRTEMGAVGDDAAVAAAVAAAKAAAGEGAVVGAYRCAFNIEKKGTPAGALPAVREMAKKKAENEDENRKRLATDGKTGTV
jgi:hypothetical protein